MCPNRVLVIACLFLTSACTHMSQRDLRVDVPFVRKTCDVALDGSQAQCGTVNVPENWTTRRGRRIDLNVIVFPATSPGMARSAQFYIDGGPGDAATAAAGFYLSEGLAFREHRDVVLVDMRGTGSSNALHCEDLEAFERARPDAPMYRPDLVASCARALRGHADVRQYTTATASRDLEAVRRALGYSTIDINAVSYGTVLAQRYIADHPDRVRTAVLTGAFPPSKTPPAHHAKWPKRR